MIVASSSMFEDNLGLVSDVVLSHFPPQGGVPLEDTEAYSLGCVGLWKACRTFEKNRKNLFSTYAYHCIRNSIISGYRRNHRAIPTFDPKELDKNCSPPITSNFSNEKIISAILSGDAGDKPKDKIDREMLIMYYLGEMTLEQIGNKFKVSKNRVRQRVRRAIEFIRQKYSLIEGCDYESF
jgi:RNA polymerase sigma factor (sigma-70 family)